jgi:hypothetical protein
MKKNHLLLSALGGLLATCLLMFNTSCSEDINYETDVKDGGEFTTMDGTCKDGGVGGEGIIGEGGGENNGNSQAGIVTAGEWCDLSHWSFWAQLMNPKDSVNYSEMSDYWKCYTDMRVAVKVTDKGGQALANVPVVLSRSNGAVLWKARTDVHGLADCWAGFFQKENIDGSDLCLTVDGQVMEDAPMVTVLTDSNTVVNVNTVVISPKQEPLKQADIAFVVDATGSMFDEIDFLKSDLADIIGKVSALRRGTTMRTAALFYRDEGDEYVTRPFDFTTKTEETADFVGKQQADGGGDYPEAVHTALDRTLQDLSWNENARTRLAFLILDAPAHHNADVITSLQKSIRLFAESGIRLIPVAASGVDKNTEFMCRFFAIATGGTYVFLTNDSGVGGDHIAASVGDYEVEQLNELLIRLISFYTE